ncbi:MAG TPA: alpha/beta fold hydrolase, partial [Candidatus Limnocylindrales bacterium]|nr:alpha/beta fold hydrolase [Candidatus Limnocylindrales bacterium]
MHELAGKISYRRQGSGEPLVLIHGLGATKLVWKPQLEALSREREVIALDMPGFGESPSLAGHTPPTAAALGAAITEFLLGLGFERPHVAGNSLGGWVALEMAKAGAAASACLISPAGLWQTPLGPRSVNTRGLAKLGKPLVMLFARRESTRLSMLRTVVGRPERVPVEDALQMIRDWIDAPGYADSNEAMRRHVFEDPGHVRVPVTIAWGELDRLVAPPKEHRRPRGTRFIVLDGCGHTPNWDDPELITRVLL